MWTKKVFIGLAVSVSVPACAQAPQIQEPAPPVIPQTPEVVVPSPLEIRSKVAEIEAGRRTLTASEAVAIALLRQPQIGIARGNVLTSQGLSQQARSALRPTITGAAGYNDARSLRGADAGTSKPLSASVGVEQLLFDFGRARDLARQQNALEQASLHSLSATRLSIALQAKQGFYDLAQSLANLILSEADVANRQRQLDEARARVTAGVGAPSDLLQAKTNLADASIALVSARESALAARISLAQTLGIDPRTPLTPGTSVEPNLDGRDLDSLVEQALKERPDVYAARDQVASSRFGLSAARKDGLPSFSISTGVAGTGHNDPLTNQSAVLGINVAWTFGDGGFIAGGIHAAKGRETSARENLISVSQQAVAEVTTAYLDVAAATQRESLASVSVANALELVRISEGRYSGGIGLFLDVTNAQNSLVSAQRSLTQAQGDIQRARARLRNSIGDL